MCRWKGEAMSSEEASQSSESTHHYLHLSPEALAQLSADERLQACLEMRRVLDSILGVLYTPDSTLIDRAVTIDLLYTEAERLSRQQGAGEDSPVTYAIKTVSERLGIRPAAVRQAYEHLDALDGVHILARQFPGGRRQQRQLPLDATGAGES